MLIVKSNPTVQPLPKLESESMDVKRLIGAGNTTTVEQAGFSDIGLALRRNRVTGCHLILHGDAKAYCTNTLGGTAQTGRAMVYTMGLVNKNGDLDRVDPQDLVKLFAPYSIANGGELEFIFINGCNSDGYGMSLNKAGFVVVCWQTRVHDDAAAEFAAAYYEDRVKGSSFQKAFNFAKQTISAKFELRDPDVVMTSSKPAGGIPKLLL